MSSSNIASHSRLQTHNVTCDVDEQEETLYTCPANCRSHVSMFHIVNYGGTVSVDVTFNRASATQTALGVDSVAHILGSKNMSSGDYIQFTGAEMIMETGDTIRITADGTTPTVDAMCTVEEFFILPG